MFGLACKQMFGLVCIVYTNVQMLGLVCIV